MKKEKNDKQEENTRNIQPGTERKRVRFGIKWKLICGLFPTVICIIAVILVLVYNSTSRMILEKSESILETSTQSVKNNVKAWMNETITALDTERDAIQYFSLDAEKELDYIKHTADRYESFPAGIYLATTEGELIHSSFVPDASFNVFEKPWYKEGIESEKFIFGSVYYDEDSQSYVVGASGVLKGKNGDIRGVAAADIYLDAISKIVEQVQLEQTGGMFLIDKNTDMIIGHKEQDIIGTALSEQENGMYQYVGEQILAGKMGIQKYTAEDGNGIYLDLQEVEGSNWITAAYVPEAEIMGDLNSLTVNIIKIAAVGILILILFMERLVHLTVKPVKKINGSITSMTAGDFTEEVHVRTRDEIGHMAAGLRRFMETMRHIIGNMEHIASSLGSQSERSADVAEKLSKASEQQSEAMNEMTHTINELTLSISEVAENANSLNMLVADTTERGKEAEEHMKHAVEASRSGREDMEKVAGSMEDITGRMEHLEESAKSMNESVMKISSIVEMIGDISEETNLLSLNASIEAARAGEAGKGFAVVADQIGTLAATSKSSADKIALLTEEISALVTGTVEKTMENAKAIGESQGLVVETRSKFQKIFDTIGSADDAVTDMTEKIVTVNEIAASLAGITQEQSASSEEILATTENIKENALIVSQYSKEVEEESEHLLQRAGELKESVDNFKI